MKKVLILLIFVLCICGCKNTDDFSDNFTYTTIYPVEYATNSIFSEFSNVLSVYPNEIDIFNYTFTEKQLGNFAKADTFIYSGLLNEAPIARDLINGNGSIQIVDAMKGMSYNYRTEELWLDPSNYLMICRNIKEGLIDYNENVYTKEKIEENYKLLKESISELDVELYSIGKNGNYDTIVVSNNLFNYLTKYGINVISLESNNEGIDKSYAQARKLIDSKKIKFIYTLKGEKLDDSITQFITDYKVTKIEINPFYTLTDEERNNGETYISMMNEIIDLYKKELYK